MKTASGRKNLILSVISLTVALSVFIVTVATYAWFTTVWRGERVITATTGEGDLPSLNAWIFDITGEENGETVTKAGSWRSALGTGTGTPNYSIKKVTEGNLTGNTESLTFKSLHLGTVDNLLQTSNDNLFYMRFDVTDVVKMGRKVRAKYSVSVNDVTLYDLEGSDHVYGQENEDIPFEDFLGVFQIELAASATSYNPMSDNGTDDTATVDALNALFAADNTAGYVMLENGEDFADVFAAEKSATYYLYLRISPHLENCMSATEVIATLMPCELTFDINFEIEFYEIHG